MIYDSRFAEISSNSVSLSDIRTSSQVKYLGNQETSLPAVWGAFQAGMHVLQQYAGRSPANPETIAKANLQLLHRSLLKDPDYVQALQKVFEGAATYGLPTSHCIFTNQSLRADFLTLKSGSSIQLKPHLKRFSMYLSISGRPLLQTVNHSPLNTKSWWNRYTQSEHSQSLKNGEAIVISEAWKGEKRLVAEENECIFLRIRLAA